MPLSHSDDDAPIDLSARHQSALDEFVRLWGEMASQWGINRTMALIHALLYASSDPLDTDAIMERLAISRGNANMNLRALLDWGLVRKTHQAGSRKDFYEAEQDVWRITTTIIEERQRREIAPVQRALSEVALDLRQAEDSTGDGGGVRGADRAARRPDGGPGRVHDGAAPAPSRAAGRGGPEDHPVCDAAAVAEVMTAAEVGREGERIAAEYLEAKGYRTMDQNYRFGREEIDLVMFEPTPEDDGGEIVFVEVKARTGTGFGRPEDAVDEAKQKAIRRVAEAWLHERKMFPSPVRFDVVAVLFASGGARLRDRALRERLRLLRLMDWGDPLLPVASGAAPEAGASGGAPSLLVHGGAWAIPDDEVQAHLDGLERALARGRQLLARGASALETVVEVVAVLEAWPAFDAGLGAVLDRDGRPQLDAGVMDGSSLAWGAVAGVRSVAHPVRLARHLVHADGQARLLVGEGAERFAAECGMPYVEPERLIVERERQRYEALRASGDFHTSDAFAGTRASGGAPRGTVGCVARDASGRLASATSTGGAPYTRSGPRRRQPHRRLGLLGGSARGALGHGLGRGHLDGATLRPDRRRHRGGRLARSRGSHATRVHARDDPLARGLAGHRRPHRARRQRPRGLGLHDAAHGAGIVVARGRPVGFAGSGLSADASGVRAVTSPCAARWSRRRLPAAPRRGASGASARGLRAGAGRGRPRPGACRRAAPRPSWAAAPAPRVCLPPASSTPHATARRVGLRRRSAGRGDAETALAT